MIVQSIERPSVVTGGDPAQLTRCHHNNQLEQAYEQLLDGVEGLPTNDVVAWLDHHLREMIIERLKSTFHRQSLDDLYEGWSACIIFVYEQALTGNYWDGLDHVIGWCFSFARSRVKYIRMFGPHQRFGQQADTFAIAISQLEDEQFGRLLEFADTKLQHKPALGRSVDWLTEAIADLKPKQREAIDLILHAGHESYTASEYLGRSTQTINHSKISAMYRIAIASPHLANLKSFSRTDFWVRAARAEMTATQWNVFELVILDGLSERKAAELLGTSQPAVTMNKQRAVLKLASCYSTYGKEVA